MKKWLQLALVFILTLSLVAPAAVQAEGQSNYITTTELASEPTDTALTEPKCTTVQVRVESWLETLIPLQELCVEAFDDSNLGLTKEEPVVGHVLLAALDNAVDKKVTRADAVITGGGYGMYLKSIGKYGEFSMGTQMDGWMYKKNFSWANGMSIEPMESGDRYDIYYVGNYGEVSFTEMTATKQVITRGDTTVVTLIDKDTQQPVADATIYIDGQASTIKTDAKGQATISFDSVGQHEISAEKYREDPANMEDNNNIIRPVPVTIEVTEVVNVSAKEVSPTIAEAIANASAYMSKDEPKFGSEWKVLALARGNYAVQEGYFDTYYNNVVKHLQDKGGVLAGNHTEYSRLIIALTAIGKDPRNVGGYNLLEKLSDYKKVVGQGINGATFGLIALDTHRYEIPQVAGVETITTREKLIGEISGKEIPGGGFAFFGTKPDPDMTGMAIQALAPYKNQPEVRAIIDRAIVIMDKLQLSNGGYNSWGENVQSPAQILTALSALGIDAKTDERFIQDDGSWIVSAMMDYYDKPTGAFKQGGKPNGMATEQATYGLVAYKRFLDNKSSLYDMTDVVLSTPPPAIPTTKQAYGTVGQYMVSKVPNPKFLDEWEIITLSRGGYAVPANYYEAYYNNVVQHVKDVKGVLHKVKYTEYSRLIMALTAIGKDPTNVGGYNLLEKLADYNLVIKQGINGAIFGLIALDTKAYKIPELAVENVTTREKLIQHILDKEIAGGGFALSGKNPDPDITAMAIQALSKYQGNTKTAGEVSAETMAKVKAATDRAITVLANLQTAEGGYQSWGTANSESASQVVTALASLGIDANVDSRFNKVLGNIMTFYSETDGGFKHVISEKQANGMATQQAGYTLAAHQRVVDGKPGLYDMSDVVSGESPDPGEKPDPPTNPGEGDGGTTTPPTNPEPPVETKKTVNMSIVISSSEVPLPSSQIEVKTGETALDVLKRATTLNGIALKVRDTNYGLYVEGINGLSEFDRGPLSGWMYRVNGVFPNMSAGYFTVKAGDRIEWLYTTNLGEDIGGGFEGDGSTPGTGETPKPEEKPEEKPGDEKPPTVSVENDGKDIVVLGETKNGETKVEIPATSVKEQLQNKKVEKLVVTDGKGISVEIPKAAIDPSKLASMGEGYKLVVVVLQQEINGQKTITVKVEVATAAGKIELINTAKAYMKVSIPVKERASDAVLLQLVNGKYEAVPHQFVNGKIVLQTKINGTFVISTKDVTFNDIAKVFNKDEIEFLAKRHVVTGREDGSFAPNEAVTRGHFAAIIARALGLKAENESQFKDTKGKWYAADVQALYEAGITKGKTVDTFNPEAKITRQQAAAFAARILEYLNHETEESAATNYKDQAIISKEFQANVALVNALGIMSGKANGNFDPRGHLTRGQLAKVVKRTLVIGEMM